MKRHFSQKNATGVAARIGRIPYSSNFGQETKMKELPIHLFHF